jgi:hypothetical protein
MKRAVQVMFRQGFADGAHLGARIRRNRHLMICLIGIGIDLAMAALCVWIVCGDPTQTLIVLAGTNAIFCAVALACRCHTEIEQFATYERSEPPHITNAFLRAMNRTSPNKEVHLPIYTDEELNRF